MEDEEWQDGMDEDFEEVVDSGDNHPSEDDVQKQLEQYVAEQEEERRLEDLDAIVAMITEKKYSAAVRRIHEAEGDGGVMELLFAIERATGWHMEIVASKSDVEDALFNWYGIYDPKAWEKAKNTTAWERTCYDVNFVARRGLGEMVREITGDVTDENKSSLRRILFSLWKTIDLKLS